MDLFIGMSESMAKDEAKKQNCVDMFSEANFFLKCRNKPIVFQIYKTDECFDKLFLVTFCQLSDFLGKKITFGLLDSAALASLGREFATVTHFD